MKEETKWENLGDINFVAYGGCLVKPHWSDEEVKDYPSLRNTYDVFYLNPEASDDEDIYSAAMYCVDLDDLTQEQINDMLEVTGYDEYIGKSKEELKELGLSYECLAKEMVEGGFVDNATTYKAQYPCELEDYLLTTSELYDWLRSIGAEEHIPEEEK